MANKGEIAYLLLKEEVKRKLRSIQEEILSSLDGCEIESKKVVEFSATLIKEALNELLGEES